MPYSTPMFRANICENFILFYHVLKAVHEYGMMRGKKIANFTFSTREQKKWISGNDVSIKNCHIKGIERTVKNDEENNNEAKERKKGAAATATTTAQKMKTKCYYSACFADNRGKFK